MKATVYIGGLVVVAIIVVAYYMSRTGGGPTCVEDSLCPETWIGSDGKQIPPDKVIMKCDRATYKPQVPNMGRAGHCQNPCKPGETPCWNSSQSKGYCTPAGRPCPCSSDTDCNSPKGTCNASGTCDCVGTYTGADCSVKGSCAPGQCGRYGSCNAAGGACFCIMPNFDPRAPSFCKACLPGWGPPGTCDKRWITRVLLSGCQTIQDDDGCRADPATNTTAQVNDKGVKGTTTYVSACDQRACSYATQPLLCRTTGYIAAGPDMTCPS